MISAMPANTSKPSIGALPNERFVIGKRSEMLDAVILLFDHFPRFEPEHIKKVISATQSGNPKIDIEKTIDEPSRRLYATVRFGGHDLRLFGLDSPVPEYVMEKTISVSGWNALEKQTLRRHRSHILCFYKGASIDAMESQLALYKVASTFADTGLIGTLDETAWNCLPLEQVRKLTSTQGLASCRQTIPAEIWTGFVQLKGTDGKTWICSKGHERFGLPNFACRSDVMDVDSCRKMFCALFSAGFHSNSVFKAGQTIHVDGHNVRGISSPFFRSREEE